MYDACVRAHAVILLFALSLARPLAAQSIAPLCEIRGTATLAHVHVTSGPPALVSIDARAVALTPIAQGLFHVRTLDEGRPIEGTTDESVSLVTAQSMTLGPARVQAGASVRSAMPESDGVRVTIVLAPGVLLTRAVLRCSDLTIGDAVSRAAPPIASGPTWAARTSRLTVRTRPAPDGTSIRLHIDDRARWLFAEQERRAGWARIEAHFDAAVVGGWVRDTDLTRP